MRAVVIVIDSLGTGALPDAAEYGDEGANTLLHIAERFPKNKWPVLHRLGLGNAARVLGLELPGCGAVEEPSAAFGVMCQQSPGKDTITGHWEIAGIVLERAFHTFPPDYPSFPEELVRDFTERTGRGILGNKAASGTEIIKELGKEHVRTGKPIVYTSADSVFQIAAHEQVIPVEELYQMCHAARELCDPYNVARVIARPFVRKWGRFKRTRHRHDFTMRPPAGSVLDALQEADVETVGVGKIGDIFNGVGITRSYPDQGNPACIKRTLELLRRDRDAPQFIFVNLVDTDMLYGHRRNTKGYYKEISRVDRGIQRMLDLIRPDDLFVVTADHGNDPTFRGTDHTREYVPLLVVGEGMAGRDLGTRATFSDVGQSIANFFGIDPIRNGTSFLA
ncbi:MAG: phosphopentomutase [Promethearchaeota archaeon]